MFQEWNEKNQIKRKHAGLVVLRIYFYFNFCFGCLISQIGEKPNSFSLRLCRKEQKGDTCNDANDQEQQQGKESWHLPARSFPNLHFFCRILLIFLLLMLPLIQVEDLKMFFQAWTPKSWGLHLNPDSSLMLGTLLLLLVVGTVSAPRSSKYIYLCVIHPGSSHINHFY